MKSAKSRKVATVKSSSGDGPCLYLKPSFIRDNKWWEQEGNINIDKNGGVDVYHESSPRAKAKLEAWYQATMDRFKRTRGHNL